MGTKTEEAIHKSILKILKDHNLKTDEDIPSLINQTLNKQENNIRFACNDKSGKRYIFKYSAAGLSDKTKQTGIRAKLNLKNEVTFYIQTDKQPKKHIVIPKLLDASTDPAWLIIEFLENAEIFTAKFGFGDKPFPDFFATTYIEGIKEFQELKVNKRLFHKTTAADTKGWVNSLTAVSNDKISQIFDKYAGVWDKNSNFVSHMDILTDTIGYDKISHKLVLLDFEKVQISHRTQDFSAITTNVLIKDWNKNFEKILFKEFKSTEFKTLYNLTKLLRILTRLNNYKTGRLDHIFVEILGSNKFEKIKTRTMPLLEREAKNLTNSL